MVLLYHIFSFDCSAIGHVLRHWLELDISSLYLDYLVEDKNGVYFILAYKCAVAHRMSLLDVMNDPILAHIGVIEL